MEKEKDMFDPNRLPEIDSATQYPSIFTYHALGNKGRLTDEATEFEGDVVLTEKVDGTNGRIVLFPDGDYLIGSRKELLYAKGDRVANPTLGIVSALRPLAEQLAKPTDTGQIYTLFLEVYGSGIGAAAKQYSTTGLTGYRLFDIARFNPDVLTWNRERIASWRDNGGQDFHTETEMLNYALAVNIPLTPRLGRVPAQALPKGIAGMQQWLLDALPSTRVALDDGAKGQAEGIVLRTEDRKIIAKARFEDYARTLRSK
jgi:hypothetical protein